MKGNERLEQLDKYKRAVVEWALKLSPREKVLVALPLAVLLILGLHTYLVKPVQSAFAAQSTEINSVEQRLKDLGNVIKDFARLKTLRKQIEEDYKEIKSTENPRVILENIIKNKLGLPPRDFTLPDPNVEEFGGNYEKTTAKVQLRNISDLDKLVGFLEEVVNGPNPFLVKNLDLDKGVADRFLRVDMEVSSIRRK